MKTDLEKSPINFGFNQAYWTGKLIAAHIKSQTKITYSASRICELVKEWGFTLKRPRMKSKLRDEQERANFIAKVVPTKIGEMNAIALKLHLELDFWFTDEAGFRRDGTIRAAYFKKGAAAEILESNGRFQSIKMIGAVNPMTGGFHLKTVKGKVTLLKSLQYVKDLSQKSPDKYLVIIHDNAPWHGVKNLSKLLLAEGVTNMGIINLPKYSPDMNPCERFWKWMREEITHCQYYDSLQALMKNIWKFYRRANYQTEKTIRRLKPELNIFSAPENLLKPV